MCVCVCMCECAHVYYGRVAQPIPPRATRGAARGGRRTHGRPWRANVATATIYELKRRNQFVDVDFKSQEVLRMSIREHDRTLQAVRQSGWPIVTRRRAQASPSALACICATRWSRRAACRHRTKDGAPAQGAMRMVCTRRRRATLNRPRGRAPPPPGDTSECEGTEVAAARRLPVHPPAPQPIRTPNRPPRAYLPNCPCNRLHKTQRAHGHPQNNKIRNRLRRARARR